MEQNMHFTLCIQVQGKIFRQIEGISMNIESLLGLGQVDQSSTSTVYKKQLEEEESTFTPRSWGEDTVSISSAARTAQQQAISAQSGSGEENTAGQDEDEGASKTFAEYMEKARGGSGSSGSSTEDQIEELEKRIATLQSRLAQVASNDSLPEGTKQGQVQSLSAEIGALTAQLSVLKSEQAQSQAG